MRASSCGARAGGVRHRRPRGAPGGPARSRLAAHATAAAGDPRAGRCLQRHHAAAGVALSLRVWPAHARAPTATGRGLRNRASPHHLPRAGLRGFRSASAACLTGRGRGATARRAPPQRQQLLASTASLNRFQKCGAQQRRVRMPRAWTTPAAAGESAWSASAAEQRSSACARSSMLGLAQAGRRCQRLGCSPRPRPTRLSSAPLHAKVSAMPALQRVLGRMSPGAVWGWLGAAFGLI